MKKRVLSLLAGLTVAALALTGCGGDTAGSSSSSAAKTLKVGATAVPHAEILEAVKPVLEKDGVKLEIVEFNDYVQPNLALNDKELDANFFQHKPYLDNFMEEHKDVKLKSAFGVHIEPMGIYSKKVTDLKDLKDGASISIPNDPTNGGRALLLLEKAGLLKLKAGVGEKATVQAEDATALHRGVFLLARAIRENRIDDAARLLEDAEGRFDPVIFLPQRKKMSF